ncbi:hypothetical protein PRELSG_0028800 [Plasmodium relictum]|uniref:Uncharacterized protein n=1 Tax=Plasmodium relictum TaxID=85471 RepID=A0A1J1GKP1_PLARL|nr:hypothetical protein PRELSG_0028800 [Plasmodium relictum]CRG84850.1 hypothetical protein PRELSG_0028800 [Plasmodium relictum]
MAASNASTTASINETNLAPSQSVSVLSSPSSPPIRTLISIPSNATTSNLEANAASSLISIITADPINSTIPSKGTYSSVVIPTTSEAFSSSFTSPNITSQSSSISESSSHSAFISIIEYPNTPAQTCTESIVNATGSAANGTAFINATQTNTPKTTTSSLIANASSVLTGNMNGYSIFNNSESSLDPSTTQGASSLPSQQSSSTSTTFPLALVISSPSTIFQATIGISSISFFIIIFFVLVILIIIFFTIKFTFSYI